MLEKMDLDFDENGNWNPPTIVMHPDLWEAKKDEIKSWETDDEFLSKQKEIIEKRRKNGVIERIIENWLTKVNEKSIPGAILPDAYWRRLSSRSSKQAWFF